MVQKFVLGTKGASSQVFMETGIRVPTTLIHTPSCYVVDVKSIDRDGYWAIQLGFKESKNVKNPQQGHIKKAGIKTPLRFLREIRLNTPEQTLSLDLTEGKKRGIKIGECEFRVGDHIQADKFFAAGDRVEVTRTSKGKGFQGVVRRHGFHGGPRTHGQSDRERSPGSIGTGTTPGRVLKGKRMAGRMGTETVTIKNLEVLSVTSDEILLKGLVPGPIETLLILKSANLTPTPNESSDDQPDEQVIESTLLEETKEPEESKKPEEIAEPEETKEEAEKIEVKPGTEPEKEVAQVE